MPRQDLFAHPFEQGTRLKLKLLENYIESWIPTFAASNATINIFDFFCGPGQDGTGVLGSPLRAINAIKLHKKRLAETGSQVHLYLFDHDQRLIEQLETELLQIERPPWLAVHVKSLPFKEAFTQCEAAMHGKKVANFVFLDPCGLLDNAAQSIDTISKISRTDWLLFLPAQHICRFSNTPEFQNKFGQIDLESIQSVRQAHKALCEHIRNNWLNGRSDYYLVPFAIQKAARRNINTLIFGSGHIRGLDKYLKVLWDKSENGEANFSLEGDLPQTGQLPLLDEMGEPNKIKRFQEVLKKEVLAGKYSTNKEVFIETVKRAFRPTKHAKPVLQQLFKEGRIEKISVLSYESIWEGKVQSVKIKK